MRVSLPAGGVLLEILVAWFASLVGGLKHAGDMG